MRSPGHCRITDGKQSRAREEENTEDVYVLIPRDPYDYDLRGSEGHGRSG